MPTPAPKHFQKMRTKRRKRSVGYTPQKKKQKTKMTKVPTKDVNEKFLQIGPAVTTGADASATVSLPSSENANLSVQTADSMTTVDASETVPLSSDKDCNASEMTADAAIAIDVSKADTVSSSENMNLSSHAANLQTGAEVMTEAEAAKTAVVFASSSEQKNASPETENLPEAEAEVEVETSDTEDYYSAVLHSALFLIGLFVAVVTILVMFDNVLDLMELKYCYDTGIKGWCSRFSTMGSPVFILLTSMIAFIAHFISFYHLCVDV